MQLTQLAYAILLVATLSGCKKSSGGSNTNTTTNPPVVTNGSFAKGADISWLTQMEASGYKFYNSAGTATDCIQLMQSLGMNAIRLRVWVNPSDGWCNNADLVAKALRVKKLGLNLLLDIHYSDVWADPGHQTKPAAWTAYDFPTLKTTVFNYTKSVLDTLKQNGVVPKWVQVGNETSDGMLWPDGRASLNMANFAALISQGYQAVKASNDSIKVIVHLANGYDNPTFRWLFDGLKANGANWDIIGMSLYPTSTNWQSYNDSCLNNMNDMVSRYGKQVMICEIGMPESDAAACQSFITDLISKTKSVAGNNGLGVFYWEPESYNNWQGYGLGAFDNTGKPTVAMNPFAN